MALVVNILVTGTVYALIKKNAVEEVVVDDAEDEEDIDLGDIKIS